MRTRTSRFLLLAIILLFSLACFVAPVVAKETCSITCEVTPQEVTAGKSTKVSVILTDTNTGAGLKRRFRLYWSMDGGNSWSQLGLGIMGGGALWTDENGTFSEWWQPSGHLPHDYLLKAHWEGDETYDGCTVIQTLTVVLPEDVPLVVENVRSFVSDSTHYVVGEVRNTGGDNLRYVKVAVGYYDAVGDTIDAKTSYIPISILTPGQISPFKFDRTPVAEVSRYEVVVNKYSVTEEEPYVDFFEFSHHRSYMKDKNCHVVGFVKNTGSMNAKYVNVLAIFYDDSNRLLGYGTSSALKSILTTGDKSPFDAYGKVDLTPHHYTLVVAKAQNTTDQPCISLQIVSHSGQIRYGSYRVSGAVKNIGLSCVGSVKVVATFYDAGGNIVHCGSYYGDPSSLIPEQTGEFEVYTYTDISNIHSYELWAECDEKGWWYDVQAGGMNWKVFITSNSSYVGDFSFNRQAKAITFNVTRYSGIGWCKAVVPKLLLGGPFTVLVDGVTVAHTQTENATYTSLSFTYQHSERKVEIVGTTVVKEASLIFCTVEPASASCDNISTTVSGYISPLGDETKGIPVTIQYSSDGEVWVEVATIISSSTATYHYDWNPTLTIGTYYVRAIWRGSTSYMNATSESVLFTVTKVKTVISFSVSKNTITEGEEVTVSGFISPAVSDKTVTLTYEKPDGSTITGTVTTGSDGSYSDIYTPDVGGSWSVTASWEGDSTHEAASSSSKSFTVKKSGCLIATATYGSELSPQVQFLRGFRDNTIYSTFAGSSFMTVFNGFYYSFSPSVASVIAGNSALRDIMKVVLYPLIGILHVSSAAYSLFSFIPELGVVMAGLVASAFIGVVYFLPFALILSLIKKVKVSAKILRLTGLIWACSIAAICVAEISKSPLMMVSTGAFVLATISTATIISLRIVSKRLIH